jgi:hypothetical protein
MAAGNRDPLAIGIAAVGLFVQLGIGLYWGGRIEARVQAVENRADELSAKQTETTKSDASQAAAIAVTTSQYTEVIKRLDRIETKLEVRR